MSYRVYVNNTQLFGNNESYPQWNDFLKKQGVKINEEGCYEADITDFMGALEVCENIVLSIENERAKMQKELRHSLRRVTELNEHQQMMLESYSSLFDLSYIKKRAVDPDPDKEEYLFDNLFNLAKNGYLFIPLTLYRACKDDLELVFSSGKRLWNFKLKEGKTIHVKAS